MGMASGHQITISPTNQHIEVTLVGHKGAEVNARRYYDD